MAKQLRGPGGPWKEELTEDMGEGTGRPKPKGGIWSPEQVENEMNSEDPGGCLFLGSGATVSFSHPKAGEPGHF